jgi:hypothetical protein
MRGWLMLCYRALVGATDADGKSILSGKTVTGFSNTEEEMVKMVQVCQHYSEP